MNGSLFEPDFSGVKIPTPRPCQTRAIEQLREGFRAGHRQQVLVMPTGSGKCLGRDTPVLMADGTIRAVQDVKVGDALLGPDGGARNVLSVATGREQLYRVIPKKGMSYVCNASHILSLRKTPGSDAMTLANGDRIEADADIVNVNVEVFAASNKTARHGLKGWRAGPLEFPVQHEELLIDPYLLGCWLGDGTQNRFAISKPPSQMVEEWKASAAKFGYEVVERRSGPHECPTWTIVSRERDNLYLRMLDSYGLRERKHIPHDYKIAPMAARLDLLAGMIDSDGHMSNSGFDWISKSRELAEDFAFVCRSVGLAAYVAPARKGIRSIGFTGDYWRVSVSGDCSIIPCRDKPAPARRQKKRHLVHGIRVEPIGEGEYFGFEIDGDHLFLLGDFTVTHNTITAMMLIHESLKKGKRATFVCDRTALINQTSAVADSLGLTQHAIIQANHPRRDNSMPFQIASIQTIQARGYWPQSDLVVMDECHTVYAAAAEFLEKRTVPVLGLTATPCTAGLGKLYTNVVNAATMDELTREGILVPLRILTCVTPDMTDAKTAGGEWTAKAASERELTIVGDVVAEWVKHGEGRKTIAFGADIAYCTELVRRFNEIGINAACYTSETPDDERAELVREFTKPDSAIRILASVSALAKGFDVKDVGCIIDARPLRKSLSEVVQMWGRGLRSSPETGKKDCILLDHSGNAIRFHDDFVDVYFNGFGELSQAEKMDTRPRQEPEDWEPSGCPQCHHKPFRRRCLSCGYEKPKQTLIDSTPGQMQEIMIGKRKAAENEADLWAQLCSYARANLRTEKKAGWCWYKFQDITGRKPPRSFSFDSAPDVPVSPALINKLKSLRIAYARRRAA